VKDNIRGIRVVQYRTSTKGKCILTLDTSFLQLPDFGQNVGMYKEAKKFCYVITILSPGLLYVMVIMMMMMMIRPADLSVL